MQAFGNEVLGYFEVGWFVTRVLFHSGGTQDPSAVLRGGGVLA